MKLKVLNVLMDERIGGPQLRVLKVAKYLSRYGIETIVTIPKGDQNYAKLLQSSRIKYYELPLERIHRSKNPMVHIKWLFKFAPSIFLLSKIIKNENIDIIHANGSIHFQANLAAFVCGKKLIWHINDTHLPKVIAKILFPFFQTRNTRIIFASYAVHNYYKNIDLLSNYILYAPVDTNEFKPGIKSNLRQQLGINNNKKVIGMVGHVNYVKGHEYFIKAASIIKNYYPNIVFVIVGEFLKTKRKLGRQIRDLVQRLKLSDKIIFTGRRMDIPAILNMFDIYVCPSISEACPITVLEAMATAKPIVATKVGGILEQIDDRLNGILVPPKSPESIADAIIYLLNNPKDAQRLGHNAREKVKNVFSLEEIANKHLQIYIEMCHENKHEM